MMDYNNSDFSYKNKQSRYRSLVSFRILLLLIFIAAVKVSYLCIPLLRNPSITVSGTMSLRSSRPITVNYSHNSSSTQEKKKTTSMPIQELSIIGERNSGTRWTVRHLTECFNHSLYVRERLIRHKHWFQHDVPNGRKRVGTAVVAVFRDPYYWIEAMRKVPHHAPLHYKKQWEEFVKTPWTMPRLPSDLEERAKDVDPKNIECQEFFNYEQIVSCRAMPYPDGFFNHTVPMSGDRPQYELRDDGSGLPYGSILDLRRDKIKNHLSVAEWDWVQDFLKVRYEDLLNSGTEFMIKHIEEVTGVQAKCSPSPPQNREKRLLEDSYINWMTLHVDWKAEALVGYSPWDSTTAPY